MSKARSIRLVLSGVGLAVVLTGCPAQSPSAPASPGAATPVQTPAASSPAPATPMASASPMGTASPVSSSTPSASASPAAQGEHGLVPLPGRTAPAITEVLKYKVSTTAGDFEMEVYPQAAPNAAKRWQELVQEGFFDNTAVSRVVKTPDPFVAQFGINPNKAEWKEKNFNDDPSYFQLLPGTVCFAKSGADHNSTQVFINYRENNALADPSYNFTVFGRVTKGMEAVEKFAEVGPPGDGLDQNALWMDKDYLKKIPDKPTMITSVKKI